MEAHTSIDASQVKTMNQDYIYSSPEKVGSLPNLSPVTDGIGGHRAGDYVSRSAVENLVIYTNRTGDGSPVMQLRRGIEAVNGMLYGESLKRKELKGMGCTLIAGVVEDNILCVVNVGDSRFYLTHGDSARQITRDHSYVEGMVAIGQMKRGGEDYNRRKNIITRALGIDEGVEPDLSEADLEEEDYIPLCSDGFSNILEGQSMYGIITGERNFKEKAALLIETTDRQGGVDNITMALVNPSRREAGVC